MNFNFPSISDFVDSDISSMGPNSETNSEPNGRYQNALVPKTVPSHLLMVSILEQLCHMYAEDESKGKELFKGKLVM